jgi:hypothetical protein
VVLPQPDGPTSATNSPALDAQANALQRLGGAIALLHIDDVENSLRHAPCSIKLNAIVTPALSRGPFLRRTSG